MSETEKITATIKRGGGYDAPWVVFHADTVQELNGLLSEAAQSGTYEAISAAVEAFRQSETGAPAVANVQQQAGGQVVEQYNQPPPQQQPQQYPQQPHWPHTQGEWHQAANGQQFQPNMPKQQHPDFGSMSPTCQCGVPAKYIQAKRDGSPLPYGPFWACSQNQCGFKKQG